MITSRRNETIKAIRRLRRRQGDAAILEGAHLVGEALAAGLPIVALLVTPGFAESEAGKSLLARFARAPLVVDPEVLESLADADSLRGALALAELGRGGIESIPIERHGLYLYLDGIQDPGNLGAIARVAEAFGASALMLAPGTVHPNHPRALRASAGSLLRMRAALGVTAEAATSHLGSAQPHWAALEAHGGRPLPGRALAGCWVLALGAERGQIADDVLRRVERRWTIPLAAPVESLNVAVAVGIALHALRAARLDLPSRHP